MTLQNKSRLYSYFEENPLKIILLAALALRILAAFFSKGYAFHDDHFDVLRVADHWSKGMPHWLESVHPPNHSMVYAGVNAAFMWVMNQIGMTDPEGRATVLRILHAFYSLLVVYFGFKITNLLSNKRNAIMVGWMLAVLWFMPYLSVKFLAELVCLPPVMAAFYIMLKAERHESTVWRAWLIAGIFFGIAFTIRYHTVLFAGGLGLVLLANKKWIESVLFTAGFLLITFVLIATPDMIFFDYPYQSVADYFLFNSENAYNYVTGSPFKFLLTTFGFLVPPVSVFLMWGYIKTWKIEPKIFVAILIFFLVHSFFPNKQERFLLPMYPLLIILGVIGWNNFKQNSGFWNKYSSLHSGFWNFFWVINIIVAMALSLTFTKKDRVAPLSYLSKKTDVTSVIIESERGNVKQPPVYYLGGANADYQELMDEDILGMEEFKLKKGYLDTDFIIVFTLGADKSTDELKNEIQEMNKTPNYVIFKGDNELEARKQRVMSLFPEKNLRLEKKISPSNFDQLLHFFNPRVHRNQVAHIYKFQ